MSQDHGASARADRAATPSEPSQSNVVSGTAGIPCAFTPGPWFVGEPNIAGVAYIMADDNIVVAEIERDEQTFADASLIAAAPQLFAELQQFVNGVETGMIDSPADETLANITQRAKAALAKARGQ